MRIYTKEKDYYDSIQAHGGYDVVYRRASRTRDYTGTLPGFERRTFPRLYEGNSRYTMPLNYFVLGFCGNIYPMVQFHRHDEHYNTVWTHCYNYVEMTEYLDAHHGGWRGCSSERPYNKSERRKSKGDTPDQKTVAAWFAACERDKDRYGEMFLEAGSPSFSVMYHNPYRREDSWAPVKPDTIVWDQTLGQYDFVRVIDPYTAFQEVAMFLANLASPEKPIPEMSDAIKIDANGFDKHSFRKSPAKC